jgi:hypothetical protein
MPGVSLPVRGARIGAPPESLSVLSTLVRSPGPSYVAAGDGDRQFGIGPAASARLERLGASGAEPPIPERVVDPAGEELFGAAEIRAGQEVFLQMSNGSSARGSFLLNLPWFDLQSHSYTVEKGDEHDQARKQPAHRPI